MDASAILQHDNCHSASISDQKIVDSLRFAVCRFARLRRWLASRVELHVSHQCKHQEQMMHTPAYTHEREAHIMVEHVHFNTAIRRGQSPPSAAAVLRLQAHPFYSPSVSAYVHKFYSCSCRQIYLELPQADTPSLPVQQTGMRLLMLIRAIDIGHLPSRYHISMRFGGEACSVSTTHTATSECDAVRASCMLSERHSAPGHMTGACRSA